MDTRTNQRPFPYRTQTDFQSLSKNFEKRLLPSSRPSFRTEQLGSHLTGFHAIFNEIRDDTYSEIQTKKSYRNWASDAKYFKNDTESVSRLYE